MERLTRKDKDGNVMLNRVFVTRAEAEAALAHASDAPEGGRVWK